MSVISVKLNDDDEIEYMNADYEYDADPADPLDNLQPQQAEDADMQSAAAGRDDEDGDEQDDDEQEPDDDADDPDLLGDQQHSNGLANVLDHDPGAALDAAMAAHPPSDEDDDDERNTVLVPNRDGSMTIKRKAKTIIEHVCGKCTKSYKSMASLKRHLNLCRHVPKNPEVAQRMKQEMQRSVTSTSLADVRDNECFCCFEDKASAHVGFIACNFCPKTFKSHINLERHLFTLHSSTADWACTVCNAQCASETIYELHVESHGEGKPFACGKCGKEFTRKYHLDRHLEYTECDPARPKQRLPCNVCGKEFTRLDNLREHLRSHMGQAQRRKDYQCPYCDKSFYGSSLLNIHIRTHTGERPFPCDLCTSWFPSNGALRKHRRTHTGEKPYECSVCSKCFSVKETLNRHMKIHTGDRKHLCTHCPKKFIQAQQLKAHLFYHTGENGHECPHCPQRFNKRGRLEAHISTVHDTANQLTCDVCQQQFRFKGKLAKHLREHIREAKAAGAGGGAGGDAEAGAPRVKRVKREAELENDEADDEQLDEFESMEEQSFLEEGGGRLQPVLEIEMMPAPAVQPSAGRSARRRLVATTIKVEPGQQQHQSAEIAVNGASASRLAATTSATAAANTSSGSSSSSSTDQKSPVGTSFPCEHCDRVFTRKGPYAMHLKSHKRNEEKAAADEADEAAASTSTTTPPRAAAKAESSNTEAAAAAAAAAADGSGGDGQRASPAAPAAANDASPSAGATTSPGSKVTCKVCKKQLTTLDALVRHMKLNHRKFFLQMFADDDGADDDDDHDDDDNDDNNDDRLEDPANPDTSANNNASPSPAKPQRKLSAGKSTNCSSSSSSRRSPRQSRQQQKVEADAAELDSYEVELIPMKEEYDEAEQLAASAAPVAASVSPLPSGGLSVDQLTANVGKLLALLVDEQTLADLGWPETPCAAVLRSVIEQCGQRPAAADTCPDYATVMRENTRMLLASVISNDSIKSLLNNHTVDEVIVHVLKLAAA